MARARGPRDDVPHPAARVPLGRAAAEGGDHEPAVGVRDVRRARARVPARLGLGSRPGRVATGGRLDPNLPVRAAVRPVDGLRGVPALAHPRGVGPPGGQRAGGRVRARAHGPDHHGRGDHHDRGVRGVRLRQLRRPAGVRPRAVRGDPARRDGRPRDPRAGDDEAARPVELVPPREGAQRAAPARPAGHRARAGDGALGIEPGGHDPRLHCRARDRGARGRGPRPVSEAAALVALAATLGAAIARPRLAPDWAVAAGAALLLVATGVLSAGDARDAAADLGPTLGFLAALLLLADGCRAAGLFASLGAAMAVRARRPPPRPAAIVFPVAAGTTAALSLDAPVVLLTPVVFATAARLRASPRPHVYACSHLANSASLLLPVSNLTNLLAFEASGLSFARFAALMALPWLAALAVEWVVLSRAFPADLEPPRRAEASTARSDAPPLPRFAVAVVGATLAGFALSSLVGLAPVWVAAAGALALVVAERRPAGALVRAVEPPFLVFVLGLALIVRAAGDHGLQSFVDALVPHGDGLLALLGVAVVSAIVANLVNNLPATLILLPVAAAGGPGPVLAMLIGVNVGPNLTYVGSLATLLWRRVVHAHDEETDLGEFLRLGALTVPPALVAGTVLLWLALRVV